MRALVIGGDGFIGKALVSALQQRGHEALATSRRGHAIPFDLARPTELPAADVAYLVASVTGVPPEGTEDAWRVNVDGTIETACNLLRAGVFVLFLSSAAVYTRSDAYARHKTIVEAYLRDKEAAIVRLGNVHPAAIQLVVSMLVDAGEARAAKLIRWPA